MNTRGLGAAFTVTVAASAMACASIHKSRESMSDGWTGRNGGVTITETQISQSPASNVWQLLKDDARFFTYQEDEHGRPARITGQRGRSSIILLDADSPLVIIDGARLNDVATLAQYPIGQVASIDIMSGLTGTVTQGTNASGGVIYIHTHSASKP
jgi:outer membrane cobalamin receptor